MAHEVAWVRWHAVAFEIPWCRAADKIDRADAACNQRRIRLDAAAHDAIHAFLDQVNGSVGTADLEPDVGVAREKIRQRRNQHPAAEGYRDIDAQASARARFRAAERALSFLNFRQDPGAALVVSRAIWCHVDAPGGSIQKLRPEMRLE